ncbi:MAG: hypothetical protein KatS3mg129_0475 [Leptospiraceae bacterium]|nr:MAG: hypothetical protein KatS3mg129_0475 [Leptospiraceae bacterium]
MKKIYIFLILLYSLNLFSQEVASKEEIDIYTELLKQSGENLYMPSPEDYKNRIQEYVKELYELQVNLKKFYKILKNLGYIDEKNITEMEFRNYKEHFFERKEMEVFTEYLRIEWNNNFPEWIIFRSRSSIMPQLNTRNTLFVLPAIQIKDSESHKDQNIVEPTIHVLASLSYSAGLGERYHFILPPIISEIQENQLKRNTFRVYDFILSDIPSKIINDSPLKVLTLQYILYRMRYLDLKIRSIIKNKIRSNRYNFYKSIPDSKY